MLTKLAGRRYAFDFRTDDVYFCTADCGWITGHSYLTYGPLLNGATEVRGTPRRHATAPPHGAVHGAACGTTPRRHATAPPHGATPRRHPYGATC